MILLGSTGSIGVNALQIARRFDIAVDVLAAGRNVELLNRQIAEFHPRVVAVGDPSVAAQVAHPYVLSGEEGICEAIRSSESDLVVNALVGFAGLRPTLTAIDAGKRVALANKESLVVAGAFLDISKITPIDSEHFGLWYLLNGRSIAKMTLTASGGSFRDTPLERLAHVGVQEALEHPNWSMGRKITIDSATMTNKLFELLEAKWLFGIERLDAIIETRSIIHALIEFKDGSTTAHIAGADMKLPIAYAMLGAVEEGILPPVDLVAIGALEFRAIDEARYPIWALREEVLSKPWTGAVVNAANEVAIEHFFAGEIGFLEISKSVLEAYERFEGIKPASLEEVYEVDREVREYCLKK